jgi:hypothetical protein
MVLPDFVFRLRLRGSLRLSSDVRRNEPRNRPTQAELSYPRWFFGQTRLKLGDQLLLVLAGESAVEERVKAHIAELLPRGNSVAIILSCEHGFIIIAA